MIQRGKKLEDLKESDKIKKSSEYDDIDLDVLSEALDRSDRDMWLGLLAIAVVSIIATAFFLIFEASDSKKFDEVSENYTATVERIDIKSGVTYLDNGHKIINEDVPKYDMSLVSVGDTLSYDSIFDTKGDKIDSSVKTEYKNINISESNNRK